MPANHEKAGHKIPRRKDKRIKLTPAQRDAIKANAGNLSQRALALAYGVDKRTIQFILNPAALEANKARCKERGGSAQYYDVKKHCAAMRRLRSHRKDLNARGLLEKPAKE